MVYRERWNVFAMRPPAGAGTLDITGGYSVESRLDVRILDPAWYYFCGGGDFRGAD